MQIGRLDSVGLDRRIATTADMCVMYDMYDMYDVRADEHARGWFKRFASLFVCWEGIQVGFPPVMCISMFLLVFYFIFILQLDEVASPSHTLLPAR